jgi:hypothetical protein
MIQFCANMYEICDNERQDYGFLGCSAVWFVRTAFWRNLLPLLASSFLPHLLSCYLPSHFHFMLYCGLFRQVLQSHVLAATQDVITLANLIRLLATFGHISTGQGLLTFFQLLYQACCSSGLNPTPGSLCSAIYI